MRKSVLAALIGGAFAVGSAQAGLILDLNGAGAGGQINADALDWAPTSFLAQGGISAIAAFQAGSCGATPSACQFDVLTHAKLTAYSPAGSGGSFTGLPAVAGEITMVARYTERVIDVGSVGGRPNASFESTGAGYIEFYYSAAADSAPLTGSGFNNGTLIGRLTGVTIGSFGSFQITNLAQVVLDQSPDGTPASNDYPGQLTVSGTGSQENLLAGTTGVDLDPSFFLTTIDGFSIEYQNISIGLPFRGTNPSDCFNDVASAAAVGTTGLASTCNTNHVAGPYSAQPGADPGYQPNVGPVNGLAVVPGVTDFIAQTDFNSAVTGVPEPGSLALVGAALGALGFAARRRRS